MSTGPTSFLHCGPVGVVPLSFNSTGTMVTLFAAGCAGTVSFVLLLRRLPTFKRIAVAKTGIERRAVTISKYFFFSGRFFHHFCIRSVIVISEATQEKSVIYCTITGF